MFELYIINHDSALNFTAATGKTASTYKWPFFYCKLSMYNAYDVFYIACIPRIAFESALFVCSENNTTNKWCTFETGTHTHITKTIEILIYAEYVKVAGIWLCSEICIPLQRFTKINSQKKRTRECVCERERPNCAAYERNSS